MTTDSEFIQEATEVFQRIVDAETNNFFELIHITGLDVKQDLAGTNLSNLDLSYVNLNSANLSNADLSNADLSNADLSNADLSNADLSNAKLNGANLTNTNLLEANLSEADLTDAALNNANLSGVDLSNVKGLNLPKTDLEAISKKREILDFTLGFSNYGAEAPIGHLGKILSSLQELIISIGQAVTNKSGQIPPTLVEDLKLTNYGIFESSYGMHLSGLSVNSSGESLLSNVLEELMSLIRVTNNSDLLIDKLQGLSSGSARTYQKFLKALINAEVKVSLERGSPKIRRDFIRSAHLSLDTSQLAFDYLDSISFEETKILEVKGKLFAIDAKKNRFGIEDIIQNKSYVGSISKEAKPIAQTATIGDIYSATILQSTKTFLANSKTKTTYNLQNLQFERHQYGLASYSIETINRPSPSDKVKRKLFNPRKDSEKDDGIS